LKSLEEANREGFVVRFSNGFRVKVKFVEYVRLHRIITNVSNVNVWDALRNNQSLDELLNNVPDEFYNWLKKTVKSLEDGFNEIERLALKEYYRIACVENIITRKEFALESLKTPYAAILFKLHDRKPYNYIIWGMLKPVFSKPFKDGYDEDVETT